MQYKQLPPNPSLEHLKSQAKQLLKAHKKTLSTRSSVFILIATLSVPIPQWNFPEYRMLRWGYA